MKDQDKSRALVVDVPDYPVKGVSFKDITPLLADGTAFHEAISAMGRFARELKPDVVVAAEARGFVCGAALAHELGCGIVLARKKGKLPRKTVSESYATEYGSSVLEIHADGVKQGQRVLVVDDLLATGGTAVACAKLAQRMGGRIVGYAFLVALPKMRGANALEAGIPVFWHIALQ